PRAGRDHDRFGLDAIRRAGFRVLHFDFVRRNERDLALPVFGTVGLDELLDAAGQLADHLVLPVDDLAHVDARVVAKQTHLVAVAHLIVALGRVDERFRRNAADVEAHAARLVFLDDDRRNLELAEPDGARIAPWPGTDDQRLRLDGFHGYPLFFRCSSA